MKRPEIFVAPDSALVPDGGVVRPAPNHFTHVLDREQAYFHIQDTHQSNPVGTFPVGTKVNLLFSDGSSLCGVVDERGLYVATACEGLKALAG